jgi:Ca2+-transporting ATPase
MSTSQQRAWCNLSVSATESELNTNRENGLTASEAAERRERYGTNAFTRSRESTLIEKTLKQFKSPLVFILLIAGVVTLVLPGDHWVDAIVIFVALLINVVIGVFQEERASRAFEKLVETQEKRATVIRNGRKAIVPSNELVPGDVVILESGAYVPADLRLFQVKELKVNESALTGEWIAVNKGTEPLNEDTSVPNQSNMAWMGTLVVGGYARGVVVATGSQTQVGTIAESLGTDEEQETPLQTNINNLARFLVYVITAAIVAIFVVGLLRGEPLTDMLLVAIAVAVATMPAGLPAAVTVVLALGMEAILKKGGLVRNLLAAETLGATTYILTDKTGTLTEAKMQLNAVVTAQALAHDGVQPTHDTYETTDDQAHALELAALASDAFVEQSDDDAELVVRGEPMEKAVLLAGLERGFSQDELKEQYPRIDFLEFDSNRKYKASLHTHPQNKRNRLIVSGAPELVIERATNVFQDGKQQHFAKEQKQAFLDAMERKSKQGMRVISVAYRNVEWQELPDLPEHERDDDPIANRLVFAGLLVFHDPVREQVPKAIQVVKRAHARVAMITGDNPQTALKIAQDAGIAGKSDKAYTGADLEQMTDDELITVVRSGRVFARVLPDQKLKIARLLKHDGEIVAMTGDGINDAPALRTANIGVAVDSGTEVAKEAADLILLNDSFTIIVGAIKEGRKIIDNLKKIVAYLLSTSFSEIFLIGGALLVGSPLPLLPAQILWANIIEEGLMSFAFAFERPQPEIMRRDPRSHRAQNLLTRELKQLMVAISVVTGVFLVALYLILLQMDLPIERIRTFMFIALSLDSILFAMSLKNLTKPIWQINLFNNLYLIGSIAISTALLITAITVPPLQTLLSLEPFTVTEFLFMVAVGIFNLLTIETVKYVLFERTERT